MKYDHHMRSLLILIVAAIGLPVAADAESTTMRTCRIVFPERPNDAPTTACLFDGKQNIEVTLPSMNFSEVITLPPGDLTILMTREKITDLENLPLNAPRLKISENVRDFYILISPDPKNLTLPVQMNLVNTSDGKLKPGETLWFNLTDHRILAKLGESRMSVAPKSQTVSKAPMPSSGYYKAEFAYQHHAEEDLQRITEQHWWHDAGSRHVGFIVNTGGMLPRLYFFRDFRERD